MGTERRELPASLHNRLEERAGKHLNPLLLLAGMGGHRWLQSRSLGTMSTNGSELDADSLSTGLGREKKTYLQELHISRS